MTIRLFAVVLACAIPLHGQSLYKVPVPPGLIGVTWVKTSESKEPNTVTFRPLGSPTVPQEAGTTFRFHTGRLVVTSGSTGIYDWRMIDPKHYQIKRRGEDSPWRTFEVVIITSARFVSRGPFDAIQTAQ